MNNLKTELRNCLRQKYSAMTNGEREEVDRRLIAQVRQQEAYRQGERIFLYASVGYEIHTHDLIQEAFSAGKTVLLPRCYGKGEMEFYEYEGTLAVGRFGIPEPTGTVSVEPARNDVMIVPGLSFTDEGVRLGQGGGYYDRYLEKYPCVTIGLCRDAFLAKELPIEWNDLPVDFVITESCIYQCKNGAS